MAIFKKFEKKNSRNYLITFKTFNTYFIQQNYHFVLTLKKGLVR